MNENNRIAKNGDLLTVTYNGLFSIHRIFLYIAFALFIAHCVAMMLKYGFEHDVSLGLVPLFDFYEEQNVFTYFSSLNLLFTAGLIFLITYLQKFVRTSVLTAWKVLGFGFLFMSLDEFSDVRMLFKNIEEFAATSDSLEVITAGFSVPWTFPIAILVILLGIYFLPFLCSLKKIYAINFAIAGTAFVFAALGLENVQGFHVVETGGVRDFKFMIIVTIEEAIEISSILYFQYFLIRYIKENEHDDVVLVIR